MYESHPEIVEETEVLALIVNIKLSVLVQRAMGVASLGDGMLELMMIRRLPEQSNNQARGLWKNLRGYHRNACGFWWAVQT